MPKVPINALVQKLKNSSRHVVPPEFHINREDTGLTGEDFVRCSRFFLCGSGTRAQLETLELQLRVVFRASVYGGFVNERYNKETERGCWECIVTVNKQKAQLPQRGSVIKLLKKIKIECTMDILEDKVTKQCLASLSRIYDCEVKVGRFPCNLFPRLEEYRREEKARRVQSSVEDHTGMEMTPDNMFTLFQQLRTLRNVVNSQARNIISLRTKLHAAEKMAMKTEGQDSNNMSTEVTEGPASSSSRSSPSPAPSSMNSSADSSADSSASLSVIQSPSVPSGMTSDLSSPSFSSSPAPSPAPSLAPSLSPSSSISRSRDASSTLADRAYPTNVFQSTSSTDAATNRYQVFFSISDGAWPQIKVGDRVVMNVKYVRYPDVLLEFGDRSLSVMSDMQSMSID